MSSTLQNATMEKSCHVASSPEPRQVLPMVPLGIVKHGGAPYPLFEGLRNLLW